MKSVPLSVRVTDEDAAFLGSLSIGQAKTPSEKLRAILLAERRRQMARRHEYSHEYFKELFSSAEKTLRTSEHIAQVRSDPVRKIVDRVTELAGVVYAGPGGGDSALEALTDLEGRLLDEVFALMNDLLQMALVSTARAYDPDAVQKRLPPILELVELINISRQRRKGGAP